MKDFKLNKQDLTKSHYKEGNIDSMRNHLLLSIKSEIKDFKKNSVMYK